MRLLGSMMALLATVAVTGASGARAAGGGAPEDVLRTYLTAIQKGDFETAYDHISAAMRGGKDKKTWVEESKAFMNFADVKIFEFRIGKAKIEGNTAKVPNVLESQDRFVNALGLTEYELYTLVMEDGAWKVDSQILLEPGQVKDWFPDAAD